MKGNNMKKHMLLLTFGLLGLLSAPVFAQDDAGGNGPEDRVSRIIRDMKKDEHDRGKRGSRMKDRGMMRGQRNPEKMSLKELQYRKEVLGKRIANMEKRLKEMPKTEEERTKRAMKLLEEREIKLKERLEKSKELLKKFDEAIKKGGYTEKVEEAAPAEEAAQEPQAEEVVEEVAEKVEETTAEPIAEAAAEESEKAEEAVKEEEK